MQHSQAINIFIDAFLQLIGVKLTPTLSTKIQLISEQFKIGVPLRIFHRQLYSQKRVSVNCGDEYVLCDASKDVFNIGLLTEAAKKIPEVPCTELLAEIIILQRTTDGCFDISLSAASRSETLSFKVKSL